MRNNPLNKRLHLIENFNINTKLDFQNSNSIEVMNYIIIKSELNINDDDTFLLEKVKSDNYTSICMKTVNVMSNSCYDIGLVKVENKKIVDMYSTYLKPYKPLSKASEKVISEDTIKCINSAPEFKDIWNRIEPFLTNNVITGAHSSERRFVYNCDKYDINLPVIAYSWCPCKEPNDAKYNFEHHIEEDKKRAIEYATEWAASKLVFKYGKDDKNKL